MNDKHWFIGIAICYLLIVIWVVSLAINADEQLGQVAKETPDDSTIKITDKALIEELVQEQSEKGSFVQVKDGVAHDQLTTKLPPYMSVDVFDGPEGKGYRVLVEYPDSIISTGYGAYAKDNTWVREIDLTATST